MTYTYLACVLPNMSSGPCMILYMTMDQVGRSEKSHRSCRSGAEMAAQPVLQFGWVVPANVLRVSMQMTHSKAKVSSLFSSCCQVGPDILAHTVGEPAHLHADCHQILHKVMNLVSSLCCHLWDTACHLYGPILNALQETLDFIHLHVPGTTLTTGRYSDTAGNRAGCK